MNTDHPTKNIFVNHRQRRVLSNRLEEWIRSKRDDGQFVQCVINYSLDTHNFKAYFFLGEMPRASFTVLLDASKYFSVNNWEIWLKDIIQKEYSAYII